MEKKPKLPNEWKKLIRDTYDDRAFEQICYFLIKSMSGFSNVELRDGGADGHRDIEADFKLKLPDDSTEIIEKWRFECKNFSKGIPFDEVSGKINAANLEKIDKFIIMSNMHLTPPCKDDIERAKKNINTKIIDWSGVKFQDILFKYPNICKDFFPDEVIPSRYGNFDKPEEILKIPNDIAKTFGFEFKFRINAEKFDLDSPEESLSNIIKENIPEFEKLDSNVQSLLYQQFAGLFNIFKKYEDAFFFINKSLEITPKNISALLNKGYILEKLNKLKDSEVCYDSILTVESNNKFALNNKAHNQRRLGNFDKALEFVEKALRIDPKFVIAINNKSSVLKEKGEIDNALEYLISVISDFEESFILNSTLVQLYIADLDFKKAFELNEKLIRKDNKNLNLINNRGVIYERNGSFLRDEPDQFLRFNNLALDIFKEIVKTEKDFILGWANRSVCLQNLGLHSDAEELINSVFDLFPHNSLVLKEKGIIELNKGNSSLALKFFEKSLKLNVSVSVLIQKTESQLRLRKNQEALTSSNKIIKIDKKNSKGWELKGKSLRNLHQTTKGGICLKKSIKFKKFPKSLLD